MDIFGSTDGQFIKSIDVHGAPGSEKSFVTTIYMAFQKNWELYQPQ